MPERLNASREYVMETSGVVSFCEDLDFSQLSPDVCEISKRCLADFVGVAFAGYQTRAGRIALKSRSWCGSEGQCTAVGQRGLVSPLAAVYINATLGSSLDFDDGHRAATGHPGVMVIPVAMAAGELASPVSGRDFITALVAGYEVALRCGAVMNSCQEKRLYGSGGWAVFGAAAAGAKLLGLTGEALRNAITIGEVYGPTAQCGKSIAYGAMTKESIGWGSLTALCSIFLAREGFTGPGEILLDDEDYDRSSKDIFQTLGKEFETEKVYFKTFPSCRWSHSPIAAVLRIREQHMVDLGAIKEVRVETFKKALTLKHQSPTTTEQAQYSVPYTVAAALVFGEMGPEQVAEKNLRHPEILDLAPKVKLVHAPDLERSYPAERPARVSIEMMNGEVFREEVRLLPGDPEFPLSRTQVIDKFEVCTGPYMDRSLRERIVQTLFSLEDLPDIKDMTRLFRHSVTHHAIDPTLDKTNFV